ncbi:MAG TPA: hypothetical protein VMB46_00290 [Methanomassiliicoccales archaeon]|nr:hypothetical protein [Methanomassiliicoccales archaeon]
MAKSKDMYLLIQNKLQPPLKRFYTRASEILPPSLVMSKRYFEAKSYLELPAINDESDEAVRKIQRELISRTLRIALESVPFYMKEVKIDPDSVGPDNAMETLERFPMIDKDTIMKKPSDFVSRNFNKLTLIYTTSGGSTGRGIALWKRYGEYQAGEAFIEDMWGKFGFDKKSRVLRIGADCIAPLDKPPCRIENRRLLVSPRHLNRKWLEVIVNCIDEFEPEFIHSYPSCLEVLAGHLREKNRSLDVKAIFLASEEIKPEQLSFFYDVFKTKICFFYGAAEHVLLGYGCYDGENVRYHMNPLYGYAENAKDEYGYELVGTGLWNEAMPLIRYRTQDYGQLGDGLELCPVCGKRWKTVIKLDGRRQYYLTTKQGTRFPGLSVWVDKFIWDYVSSFQFVQNEPGALELHIIPRSDLSKEVEKRILDAQKKRLSEWFEPITLVKESEIPLTISGKRRLVVVNTRKENQA